MPSSKLDVRISAGKSAGSGGGGTISNCCCSSGTTTWSSSDCFNDLIWFGWLSIIWSAWLFLAVIISSCWLRRCWWYCRWSEWAAMCWSETAKTARAIRGRLNALQVATAAAAVDGTDSSVIQFNNLFSTLWQWLEWWPDAWLELLRWMPPPIPSSSSLGITAPESWLDFRVRIRIDLPLAMSFIPACKAVNDSVSPCCDVLAAAAAATAAETAAVAAADVSLGLRAAYSKKKRKQQRSKFLWCAIEEEKVLKDYPALANCCHSQLFEI